MANIFNNIMGEDNFKITDDVIANDTLMGLKGAAAAYLGATLESSTPEIRRMWSSYLSQVVMEHEAMTALAIKKGWYNPYLSVPEQVSTAFKASEWAMNHDA